MENSIRKYIDKAKKQSVKEALKLTKEGISPNDVKNQFESEYEYCQWIKDILSIHCKSYLPINKKELELFGLLSIEVLYKQSLKILCDNHHPVANELLSDLGLNESEIKFCIEKVKSFNGEKLDCFDLFEDEITKKDSPKEEIILKIDQLASDASQGTIVSHPVKMTHPDLRYPKIFAKGNKSNDGFVRTGNAEIEFDMHVNAAKLKIFKFLSLKFNSNSLYFYVKNNDHTVFNKLFGVADSKAKEWVSCFSSCFEEQDLRTSTNIRQVYFPVENGYHLLSLLKPSGLVFKLKERIDFFNDRSPDSYLGKKFKKEGKFFNRWFCSLPNITATKHGGDHPKNISGLNNKHQVYYLLLSTPPLLEKQSIRFPKSNFFGETIRIFDCRESFSALHKLFITDYNNHKIREGRDYRIQEILDRIINKMWMVRSIQPEAYSIEKSTLKKHQMVWLKNDLQKTRESEEQWLEEVVGDIVSWIIRSYEKVNGKQALMMGKELRQHILRIVVENKEALR